MIITKHNKEICRAVKMLKIIPDSVAFFGLESKSMVHPLRDINNVGKCYDKNRNTC